MWRWYIIPPAPNCDPQWDFKTVVELGNGTTVNYPAAPGNVTPFVGDWGTRCDLNGAAGPWAMFAVDSDTGTVFAKTTGPYPTWNATFRPGPNLYANSIVALNAQTGQMKWFYQTTTHDLSGEQDCQWSSTLITVGGRKLIVTPCRSYFYALDAATGKLVWSYDPITNQATGTNPNKYPYVGLNMGDSMNMTQKWMGYPEKTAYWKGGLNENAPAFDGKNVYYWGNQNLWCSPIIQVTNLPAPPVFAIGGAGACPKPAKVGINSTLVALDAATGNIVWSKHYTGTGYRGGLTATAGMVLAGAGDGNIYAFDANNGNIIWQKFMGIGLYYAPTIGTDADGNMKLFLPTGGGFFWGNPPGGVFQFGLPAASQAVTTTSVATSVTTQRATIVSTQTVAGPSTGIDPGTFYGAIGVAVIFVIATGVLAIRRRKPAS